MFYFVVLCFEREQNELCIQFFKKHRILYFTAGHCKLPPTKMRLRDGRVISQIKLRCDACWLNLCVSTFKLPRPIKDIVVKMLPEDLRVLYPKETDVEEGNEIILGIFTIIFFY